MKVWKLDFEGLILIRLILSSNKMAFSTFNTCCVVFLVLRGFMKGYTTDYVVYL